MSAAPGDPVKPSLLFVDLLGDRFRAGGLGCEMMIWCHSMVRSSSLTVVIRVQRFDVYSEEKETRKSGSSPNSVRFATD